MLDVRPDPRHPHVLVVDDDADTRDLYHIMLEAVGYRVESAATVRAASEKAARTTPHVVVTDWRLPDGDGFAVSEILRSRRVSRRVPIVAVSGLSMSAEMTAEAYSRGFTSILVKPTPPDDVLAAVKRANEIGIARRLQRAAVRLRRYAAHAVRRGQPDGAGANKAIDTAILVARAAARSGDNVTLMLADDSARYVAAAGSARALTGYDPQELVSLSVWDLTPPPDSASGQGLWRSFIAAGTQEGRYILRRRDGAPVEAQYCAIANVVPGLHVSAIAEAARMPTSL